MELHEIEQLAKKYGYLLETVERFVALFGFEETKKMLEAYEETPLVTIRVNTLKITREELRKKLEDKGFQLKPSKWYNDGYIVEKQPFAIGATTEYLSGYYFVQSQASWLPPIILNPQPEETIIDLAAAPGGKATHIAELMNNDGTLLCIDISRERIKSLRSNLTRCGVINAISFRMDGADIVKLGIKADKILLDAPCSGEGLMAIDRARKTERKTQDILRLASIQKTLLSAGLKSLKKDGILVYSTCSTAPEENEEVIDWALSNFPITIEKINLALPIKSGLIRAFNKNYDVSLQKAIRLYPHLHKTEGFFICKLLLQEEVLE